MKTSRRVEYCASCTRDRGRVQARMSMRRDDRCGWRAARSLAMVGALAVILALAGCGPGSRSSTPARHAAHGQTHSPLAAAYPSYEVGAYYFSGWSHGQNKHISRLLTGRMHASEPLIGWYDDSQTPVDKANAQAPD